MKKSVHNDHFMWLLQFSSLNPSPFWNQNYSLGQPKFPDYIDNCYFGTIVTLGVWEEKKMQF